MLSLFEGKRQKISDKKGFAIDKICKRLATARIKTPFKILRLEWGL